MYHFQTWHFYQGPNILREEEKTFVFCFEVVPMHSRRASNETFRPRRSWTSLTALPLPCRFWNWLQVCTTDPGLCGASYQTQGFRHARQTCQLSSVPGSICRVMQTFPAPSYHANSCEVTGTSKVNPPHKTGCVMITNIGVNKMIENRGSKAA